MPKAEFEPATARIINSNFASMPPNAYNYTKQNKIFSMLQTINNIVKYIDAFMLLLIAK